MNAEAWIAAAALAIGIVTAVVTTTVVILSRINAVKDELDQQLYAIRLSAFEEYKTLRAEIVEVSSLSRKEFGETVAAIREKVNEVELYFRDKLSERADKTDYRLRQLELFSARTGWSPEPPKDRGGRNG